MTKEKRQQLREAALAAQNGTIDRLPAGRRAAWAADWKIQTSNSFRRIGTTHGDGDVVCGTKHPIDGHPDLLVDPRVLDYIVAAQPSVVIQLLEDLDVADGRLQRTRTFAEKLLAMTKRFAVELAVLNEKDGAEMRAVVEQLEATLAEASR